MVLKYVDCTNLGKPKECRVESLDAFWKKAIDREWIVLHNASKGQQAWIAFIHQEPTPPQALKKGTIHVTSLNRGGEALFKVVREELARRKELVTGIEINSPSKVTIVTNGNEQTRNTGAFLRQSLQEGWVLLQGQKIWCPFLFGWEDLLQHLDEKISYMTFDEDKGLLTSLLRRRFPVATESASSSIAEALPLSAAEPSLTNATVPSIETIAADESRLATKITAEDVSATIATESASSSIAEALPLSAAEPSSTNATVPSIEAIAADESRLATKITAEDVSATSETPSASTISSLEKMLILTKDEDIASFHKRKAWTTHDYVKDLHLLITKREKSIDEKFDTLEQKFDTLKLRFDTLEWKLDNQGLKIDRLELTISKVSEYAVKSLLVLYFNQELPSFKFVHPVRSVKMKYPANKLLEDLARNCLKYEGKGECGKDLFKIRDVPSEVEIDIKMDIVEEENGVEKRDKCILVEVSRSPQLYTHNFHYPNKADYGPSTKLLYKLIQLERGILAVESSNMEVVAAALVNFPSFDYRSDGELKKLLQSVMGSPAKHIIPKLLGLYNQGHLYFLPF